jgi:hypothetical protein
LLFHFSHPKKVDRKRQSLPGLIYSPGSAYNPVHGQGARKTIRSLFEGLEHLDALDGHRIDGERSMDRMEKWNPGGPSARALCHADCPHMSRSGPPEHRRTDLRLDQLAARAAASARL